MAMPEYDDEWMIPPDLDAPDGAPDPTAAVAEAHEFAASSDVAFHEAIEMLADADSERWRIVDDDAAEWALRHIVKANADLAALQARADRWQEKIAAWFEQAAREPARTAEFFTAHVEWYARTERRVEGRNTVALPSGKVTTRKVPARVQIIDGDDLLAWATENLPSIIRHREDVQVSAIPTAEVAEGMGLVVPNGDGEATPAEKIPGLAVIPEQVSVTVKPVTA